MSALADRLKDPEARMRMLLMVGLGAIVVACVIGWVAMFSGDSNGAAPAEAYFWCQQQQREVVLPMADVEAAEAAWLEAGKDSETMKHVNPDTDRRTLVRMIRCAACEKRYIPESLKSLGANPAAVPSGGYTCTHCNVNALDWYREKTGK